MHRPRVYNIIKTVDSVQISTQDIEVKNIPEVAGRKNTGVKSGILYYAPEGEIKVQKTVLEPNGYLAPHSVQANGCIYILKGSGEMGNVDNDNNLINKIEFGVGDMLVFVAPMPLHYYKAGPDGAEYIAIAFPNKT